MRARHLCVPTGLRAERAAGGSDQPCSDRRPTPGGERRAACHPLEQDVAWPRSLPLLSVLPSLAVLGAAPGRGLRRPGLAPVSASLSAECSLPTARGEARAVPEPLILQPPRGARGGQGEIRRARPLPPFSFHWPDGELAFSFNCYFVFGFGLSAYLSATALCLRCI